MATGAPPPYSAGAEKGPPPAGYSAAPPAGYGAPPPAGYGAPNQAGYPPPQGGYYPPPQGGYPAAGATTNTVVVAQPQVTLIQTFRESPVRTRCPHCQADVVTATTYETGTFSWLICVILCLVGCSLGCCLIPFCVDSCQDVVHSCPNCRQQIGRWNRM